MRAEIEKIEWSQFRERRRAHEFEAAMAGLSFAPTPDQFELYHSTEVDSFNFVSLSDPEVDRLLEQGRTTFDPERRRAIYFALQQRLHELQPIGNLLHFPTPVLHDRRLRGIVPAPLDHWRITRGPREWYWAEDPPE
jgi:peptide/nickel transport system substrate-binding protein